MAGRVDADIRANETIVADGYTSFIENDKVEIGEETLSDIDLLSVVATEWLVDDEAVIT